ncbi:MAG: SDR family oxidoreductase [Candidatus Binatia bacterium]
MLTKTDTAVLVTGATGFIGRHVVARLALTGRRIVVLARCRAGVSPRERVEKIFGRFPKQIDVLQGDLTFPEEIKRDAARLQLRIDTVIHCAAETFFDRERKASRLVHIEGPLALLEVLGANGLRSWSQISTAFVCGRRTGTVYEDESDLGQEFHNAYERLKLESEIRLKQACAQSGTELRIFRPSIVIGAAPATMGGVPSNLLLTFVRLLVSLARTAGIRNCPVRIHGLPHARFNIVPVQYVARVIEQLAGEPEASGKSFHLVTGSPPTQRAMLSMMSERLGLRRLHLLGPGEALINPSPLESRIAKMLLPYKGYLEQDVQFDDSGARRLLNNLGVPMPVIDRREVDRLIQLAWSCNQPRCADKAAAGYHLT